MRKILRENGNLTEGGTIISSNQQKKSYLSPSASLFEERPEIEAMMRGLLHELRNPLSSILTAATLLQDVAAPENSQLSGESQTLLGIIDKEANRLNRILTEFDRYIRPPKPQPKIFDLIALIESVSAFFERSKVLPPHIKITKTLPAECAVWADETQIQDVLEKLLKNAVEELETKGAEAELHLRLETDTTTSTAKLCLSDNGKGFRGEAGERAFQPFYSTKTQRLGLGLSVVKAKVEAADGEVWLENSAPTEQNAFTSICFTLPLAKR